MNKNIFKVSALLVAVAMVSEVTCSETNEQKLEKRLKKYENEVYSRIGYFNVFRNVVNLSAYAEKVDGDLSPNNKNNFFSDTNLILERSPLYARKEKLEPFYGNESVKEIRNACVAKLRNMVLAAIVVTGGSLAYYFYSKNK